MVNKTIIDIKQLTVSFDGFVVLDNLDFSMQANELRCIIGPNGAGKTTFFDIITGQTKPKSGQITFNGSVNMLKLSENKIVQLGIARKFQTPSIFSSLTVKQTLEVAIGFRDNTPKLFKDIDSWQREKIECILETIGLKHKSSMRAGILSHGEKQWLEIGMLLVQEPQLLLLDEPIAGMTRQERDKTGELLQSIVKTRSVIVVEHDMHFVRQFAHKVTVLHRGRVLCEGLIDDVQNDERVIEAYIGHRREKIA